MLDMSYTHASVALLILHSYSICYEINNLIDTGYTL